VGDCGQLLNLVTRGITEVFWIMTPRNLVGEHCRFGKEGVSIAVTDIVI